MTAQFDTIKVKHLCEQIVDCVNRTAPVVDYETPFKMIRTTNVRNGRIDLSSTKYVTEEIYKRWTRRLEPRDGDVILTREAPIGEVGYVAELGEVFLGQRIMHYRADPAQINPRFLFYAFRSPFLQHQFGSHDGSGSVVSHIRVADCHEFLVPNPPRPEQDAIAETLGALDDKIEANRRMNGTLEAMARVVFRDWFVDFGPTRRQLAGASDPHAILGGLIEDANEAHRLAPLFPARIAYNGLPEGWQERPLSAFLRIVGGGTPKTKVTEYWNGEIPWFSVVDTPASGNVFVVDTEKTITESGLAESSARLVSTGTTIISARGTVGNLAIAAQDMTFNQSCYALEAKPPASGYFVYLAAENMVERLRSMAHGSVFSTITRSTFEGIFLPDAGARVSEEFGSLSAPLFERIKANVIENRTLATTRDLLLPKLMSGEIRLMDAEGMV